MEGRAATSIDATEARKGHRTAPAREGSTRSKPDRRERPSGWTRPANCRGRYTEQPSCNRKGGSPYCTTRFVELDVLEEAWRRVKSNGGAAGVDRVSIDEVREYGRERFLREIRRSCSPRRIAPDRVRRVHIPKPGQPGPNSPARNSRRSKIVWRRWQRRWSSNRCSRPTSCPAHSASVLGGLRGWR